jgi:ABC-type phosphate transport system substrate-binding protein
LFKADNVILKYTPTASLTTAAGQLTGSGTATFVSTDGLPPSGLWADDGSVLSLPVAGGALVAVYNLPGSPALVRPPPRRPTHECFLVALVTLTLGGACTQTLDGATLARIWHGEITQWNDTAIAALNPLVTLPGASISMSYSCVT